MTLHIGRSWQGSHIEKECPCPQEPCGLIDSAKVDNSCEHHGMGRCRTMRQIHTEDQCPGGEV